MPEGAHWLFWLFVIPRQAPAQLTQPQGHSSQVTFSQKRLKEEYLPPGWGGGVGGVGKVWSPVPDLRAAAPPGGRSRLKPPQDARDPLTSSVFLSQAEFLLCQHMRYGDGEGISLHRDAVPFGNICLEVPTV